MNTAQIHNIYIHNIYIHIYIIYIAAMPRAARRRAGAASATNERRGSLAGSRRIGHDGLGCAGDCDYFILTPNITSAHTLLWCTLPSDREQSAQPGGNTALTQMAKSPACGTARCPKSPNPSIRAFKRAPCQRKAVGGFSSAAEHPGRA